MNDLYFASNRDKFYKESHHIKELLHALQQADDLREIKYLLHSLHLSVDAIAEIKRADMDEMDIYNNQLTHIIEIAGCRKVGTYGET